MLITIHRSKNIVTHINLKIFVLSFKKSDLLCVNRLDLVDMLAWIGITYTQRHVQRKIDLIAQIVHVSIELLRAVERLEWLDDHIGKHIVDVQTGFLALIREKNCSRCCCWCQNWMWITSNLRVLFQKSFWIKNWSFNRRILVNNIESLTLP